MKRWIQLLFLLLAYSACGYAPEPRGNLSHALTRAFSGQSAQTYGDFTFARANVTLTNGNNTFSIVAHSAAGTNVTNNLTLNLPASITPLYDSNGNLTNDGTRSFAYDAENRLLTNWVTGAWKSEFVYDGLGRCRIERDYGWQGGNWYETNEVRFVYDGWLPIQERDTNNNVLVTYTRGMDLSATLGAAGGIGGLLAMTDGGGSTFYHADGAGNITGLMDGQQNMVARYMYSPFGRLTGKCGPMADVNEMQFSSMHVHRLSGLVGFVMRPTYDPTLQRFLTRDPIGERGAINLYAFVGNSPLSRVDPLGLDYILSTGIRSASSFNYPDTGGPTLGQTASRVGSSWLDKLWNSLLGLVGMTMHDPTGDPRTQQQLNAMAQNAQQQLGSPLARNGNYKPGSQEDVVGTGLFLLTPVPFLKGKCPTRFEGLTPTQIKAIQNAMKEAGMADANVLIKGADMPPNYAGMTLGGEGFVINRSLIDNPEELLKTLQHEYQHVLDRRALGDAGAYGQSLEDSAHAAEGH